MNWNVQVATWTSSNRYPGIFRTVQARMRERLGPGLGEAGLRILSFGCSDGSEAATLRSYFPDALIHACDVNPTALHAAADRLSMDEAVVFASSPAAIAQHGPFDVVLAMSVLCRFPESLDRGMTNLRPLYGFAQFEDTVSLLAASLAPNGIICLYNTSYDFLDTAAAGRFRTIRSPLVASNGFVDRFGPDGERTSWCERVGAFYVHRPRSAGADYTSCIFEARDGEAPATDILVPFGGPARPRPAAPPDFVRFGPDLAHCAERRLVATALGYWMDESAAAPSVTRAWSRSTPQGTVEHGTPWTVGAADGARSVLEAGRAALPPRPRPAFAERALGVLGSASRRIRTRWAG